MKLDEAEFAKKLAISPTGLDIAEQLGLSAFVDVGGKDDVEKGGTVWLKSEEELYQLYGVMEDENGEARPAGEEQLFVEEWERIRPYCGQRMIVYEPTESNCFIDAPDGYEVNHGVPYPCLKRPIVDIHES
jgi:hypothetical protein